MSRLDIYSPTNPGVRGRRLALVLTTALASYASISAYAQSVPVTGATDTTTLNGQIVTAENVPNANIAVTISGTGSVTTTNPLVLPSADSTIVIARQGAGKGDGAISFTNSGAVGHLTTGTVDDTVNVALSGTGVKAAANTATVGNTGTITGNLNATQFGGDVSITNGGTVYGGITGNGYGNVSVTTSAGATTVGGVSADALQSSATVLDATTGQATTTYTSGNSTVDQAGNAASLDGLTLANVSSTSDNGNSTVTLAGKAGQVTSSASNNYGTTVTGGTAPVAGATTVTNINNRTYSTGTSAVTVASTGSATYVGSNGAGGSTVTVDGAVKAADYNDAVNSNSHASNRTRVNTVTQDTGGNTTATSFDTTRTSAGGASTVAIDATGKVNGSVNSSGDASSSVTVDGQVTNGNVNSTSSTTDHTWHSSATYAGLATTSTSQKATTTRSGGTAALTVGAAGSVTGNVYASGDTAATVAVDGTVGGDATANQQNGSDHVYTRDITYGATSTHDVLTRSDTYAAGSADLTVAANATVKGDAYVSANGDATFTNSGTLGAGYNDGNVYVSAVPGTNTTHSQDNTDGVGPNTDFSHVTHNTETTTGGKASFTNNSGGYITGDVEVAGATGATVVNNGQVRGQTTAVAGGTSLDELHTVSQATTVASGVTTVTQNDNRNYTLSTIQADVNGTYAGTNGQAVDNTADGSIGQFASGSSTATVSGTVYGSVESVAGVPNVIVGPGMVGPTIIGGLTGTGLEGSLNETQSSVVALDGTGNGTGSYSQAISIDGGTATGSNSTVNVSGHVSSANMFNADVLSLGTSASTVNVAGGHVDGSVSSIAIGDVALSGGISQGSDQTFTAGTPVTTAASLNLSGTLTQTNGAAAVNLTGAGTIVGDVTVYGVSSASAVVAAGTKVGGGVNVTAGGFDASIDGVPGLINNVDYTFDPATGTNLATQSGTFTFGAAAASGDATAMVAGNVGSVDVQASRGNATANITGFVDGSVYAESASTTISATYLEHDTWKDSGSSSLSPSIPSNSWTDKTYSQSSTHVGGAATVSIDTPVATQSDYSVYGNVEAYGLQGATISIGTGSSVYDNVIAGSYYYDTSRTDALTPNADGSITNHFSSTDNVVGAAASVTNSGHVNGYVEADGVTGATVTNNGYIGDGVYVSALDYSVTTTGVDNQYDGAYGGSVTNPATHTIDLTKVYTPVGGTAAVTNAAGAEIDGGVYIEGKTGTVTNGGTIHGGVSFGGSVPNGTVTYHQDSSTLPIGSSLPTSIVAGPTFTQAYTLNQNGVLYDGVYVTGTMYDYGVDPQTSNVVANINLNAGSKTYGDVVADPNSVTTVNVNGGYFQGSVFGVTALNFNGTNGSVLTGNAYISAGPTQPQPSWTMSLKNSAGYGTVNVNAGVVQVTPFYYGSGIYGIDGNVVVNPNGTLVLGLLHPAQTGVGSSVTGFGETVEGANLLVSQNFTSTGTVKVGLNGSIVANDQYVTSTTPDFTAPVTTVIGASGGLFTTPGATNAPTSSASSLTVGGTLKLGGTVYVDITKGSIFTGSESQVLATAGAIDTSVAPTVVTSQASPFVTFAITTNAAKTQDTLTVARKSYSTVAGNPNAAAAAVALDKTIPGVVDVLTKDAAGIRAYSSLAQYSNVQDLANIVSNLDWNTSPTRAAEIMNELGSGSFYGSLANVHQNVAFDNQLGVLAGRRNGSASGASIWMTPIGSFAKYDHGDSGAAKINGNAYGAAIGIDMAYTANGAFGLGFGYVRNNIDAEDASASADVNTYTFGAYWTQNFGKIYANAQLAYGFSVFDVTRDLPALGRSTNGHFRGNELDGSIEIGGDIAKGPVAVTPYAKLALRHWHMNGFDEVGGGAVALSVAEASKTVFNPTIGVRFSTEMVNTETVSVRPFGRVSYTFQGDAGTFRTVRYLGDLNTADTFEVQGVNPKGYATIEAGVATELSKKIELIFGGSYSFGSGNNVGQVQGALRFKL